MRKKIVTNERKWNVNNPLMKRQRYGTILKNESGWLRTEQGQQSYFPNAFSI